MTTSIQDRKFNEMLMEHLRQDSSLEQCVEWIRNNMNPEDVFSDKDLAQWAEEIGYVIDK